jgi:8-oxo-dGTP pyrophosphatase MutT (NUDIX family)
MPNPVRQAAAIPIRDGLVCMVTSRSGRRWVIPKGRIEVRQTAADAAATEAWEEAGVLGTLSADPVGEFEYVKDRRSHQAAVFVLTVDEVREQWPEQHERRREWVTPEEAATRIEEPELRKIVRAVFRTLSVVSG